MLFKTQPSIVDLSNYRLLSKPSLFAYRSSFSYHRRRRLLGSGICRRSRRRITPSVRKEMLLGPSIDGDSRPISLRVRRAIQSIREIVGDHSESDIYQALRESDMDPNETAQKLLNQGKLFLCLAYVGASVTRDLELGLVLYLMLVLFAVFLFLNCCFLDVLMICSMVFALFLIFNW